MKTYNFRVVVGPDEDAQGNPAWYAYCPALESVGGGTSGRSRMNDQTRQVTVHYYGGSGGAAYQGWNWLNSSGISGWHVVAADDFNGDGVPDLVWMNDQTRQVTVHSYGGTGGATYQGWTWLNSSGEPGWSALN